MDIKRIDGYTDPRFSEKVLAQHGAFIVDGKPCAIEIIGPGSAEIDFDDFAHLEEIVREFRFYAEHITLFYDTDGNLLHCCPRVDTFEVSVDRIQPTQFYIDEEKLAAVSTFVRSGRDVVVPLMRRNGRLLSMDGHTRLYCALEKGIRTVRGFMTEENEDIIFFAEEAQRRGVFTVGDMEKLSHAEYTDKWDRFCDEHFAEAGEEG